MLKRPLWLLLRYPGRRLQYNHIVPELCCSPCQMVINTQCKVHATLKCARDNGDLLRRQRKQRKLQKLLLLLKLMWLQQRLRWPRWWL
jgi:hypothetical protein